MKKYILLIGILFANQVSAQNWDYYEDGNKFDGEFKVASVNGTGGETPYTSPTLVLNAQKNGSEYNFYVTGAGYAGCDEKTIKVAFEETDNIYEYKATTNNNRESWFFIDSTFGSGTSISELLSMMKKYSKMHIRLSSNCGQSDYEFTLNESSVAIDYVVDDIIDFNSPETKPVDIADEGGTDSDQAINNDKDKNSPYELKWEGDVDRDPVVQSLPKNSANTESAITVRFEVHPDGTVGRIIPLRKMNPEMEREVTSTLRAWRFSRLSSEVPQQTQWGTITFRSVNYPDEYFDEDIFVVVEQMPELIGGMNLLHEKLSQSINSNVQGRVTLQFIVDQDGYVRNPAIVRGVSKNCDEKALQIIKKAKFKPGKNNGEIVPVQYALSLRCQ